MESLLTAKKGKNNIKEISRALILRATAAAFKIKPDGIFLYNMLIINIRCSSILGYH